MGLSKLTARIKSAILPSLSGGAKAKRTYEGLFFAGIVVVTVAILYVYRVFIGFDEYLNAVLLQFNFSWTSETRPPSPDILIVKKDECIPFFTAS